MMSDAKTPRDDAPGLLPCPFCGNPSAYYGASVRCTSFSCNASMSPRWTKDVVGSAKGDVDARLALAKADTTLRWNERRADQPARVVKPLVWTEYETEGWADRADAEAGSFGVFYNIDIQRDGYRVVFDHEAVGAIGVFDTADEAMAAAQADYERRILAALLPTEAGAKSEDWRNGFEVGWAERLKQERSNAEVAASRATPPTASPDAALVEAAQMFLLEFDLETPIVGAAAEALRAALSTRPAPQVVTVQDILNELREAMQHDQGGIDYSEAVGIPISNADELRAEVKFYERAIAFIEARALAGERG